MEFKNIPFSTEELSNDFKYTEFKERGYPMAFLNVIDERGFLGSRTNYKFGLINNDGDYLWFFSGTVVAKNRIEALKIYNALLSYCTDKNLGKPFACKDL